MLEAQGMGSLAGGQSFSVERFMVQLFAVPPVCLIVGFIAALLASQFGHGRLYDDIADHLAFALTGFCLGYLAQIKFPDLYGSGGQWVWIAPVALLLYGFYTDGIAAWFLSDPKYHGDAIAIILLTEPTIATCMYSVGVVTAARRTPKEPRA